MKDSNFIKELKKYKRPEKECWGNANGARAIVFFMSPKEWTEFRRKFNTEENKNAQTN